MKKNVFGWVEIYVNDMNRAIDFYKKVIGSEFTDLSDKNSGIEMFTFEYVDGSSGCSGALVKMDGYGPSSTGTIPYFTSEDCSIELKKVLGAGGRVIKEKTSIGNYGFIGIAHDTEGNTIGFHSMK